MNRYGAMAAVLTAAAAASLVTPITAEASGNMELRRRVIQLSGILNNGMAGTYATRGEFASMLVNATSYRSTAGGASSTSVFADVPASSSYASAIRTASEQGWMSGYLGGNFKPDEPVTMRDAVKASLALLGYTNDDFTENIQEARLAQFKKLSLDSNIYRGMDEVLTREDCINLFYNLMKAQTKNGGQYGTQVFELTYNSDGEINTSSILDNSLKGPKILNHDSRNLDDLVPFDLDDAIMFLNGEASDEIEINDYATVVYYHEETKMIFAYSNDGDNKGATEGRIKAIYYDSSDPFTPVTVVLNTYHQDNADNGDEFQLTSSEMQYLFSVYGEFQVGDDVAIVWEKSGNAENASYTAVDVVGDY